MAVTVFLLACSVQVTASLTIPSRKDLRTCLESSQMNDEILLTPPLLANLLMAGLVIPSRLDLDGFLAPPCLFPEIFPTPFPPFPTPAGIANSKYYRGVGQGGLQRQQSRGIEWLILIGYYRFQRKHQLSGRQETQQFNTQSTTPKIPPSDLHPLTPPTPTPSHPTLPHIPLPIPPSPLDFSIIITSPPQPNNWIILIFNPPLHPMFKEQIYQFVKENNRQIIIGFGSYGEVKLARKSESKQYVAIKMIYGKNAQHQISLHKQLSHPKIIKLLNYYYDSAKNTTYMVLEYAGGGSLHKYIKTNLLKKEEVKRIFKEVCEAIQALHSNKVMHRDIKPENILLTDDKEVKLCDFGFASFLGDRKTLCGTYQYMAPEMIQKQPYDEKIDIWALGILLFEMVEGNAPFSGNTPEEVLNEMRKVIMFSEKFDEDEINMIKRILRVKPSNRPTIQEILEQPLCRQPKEKKSIRTTVSSDNQQKPKGNIPIPNFSKTNNHHHPTSFPSNDMKLPSSPTFPKGVFQNRPISSNSHLFKEHYSK